MNALFLKHADDPVIEHGQWCLRQMIGAEAAKRLPIPKSSEALFAANEQRVLSIMNRRVAELEAAA